MPTLQHQQHYTTLQFYASDKPGWFLKLNPNGKIPILESGPDEADVEAGLLAHAPMFDSCAICLAMLEQYDPQGKLAHSDDRNFREKMFQQAFYASGTLDNLGAYSSPIQRAVVDYKEAERQGKLKNPGQDPALVAANWRAWRNVIGPALSQQLKDNSGSGFFWHTGFTAIDVFLGIPLLFIFYRGWLNEFPNVREYYERVRDRPAFRLAADGWPAHRDPYDDNRPLNTGRPAIARSRI